MMNYTTKSSEAKCPECNGNRFILFERPAEEVYGPGFKGMVTYARKCPACNGGAAYVNTIKKQTNIPSAFYDAEYSAFNWEIYEGHDTSEQKRFVDSFVLDHDEWADKGIGLYIWSKMRGTGKTFLASTICNTLIKKKHVKTKFVSVSNLIDLVQESKGSRSDPIDALCKCDVLVLDDLGQQNAGNGWLTDILFRICDSRMQDKKITIVTSNKKLWELEFDDRILDRLNQMTQMIPLPDYCVRKSEATQDKRDLFKALGLIGKKPSAPEQTELELVK